MLLYGIPYWIAPKVLTCFVDVANCERLEFVVIQVCLF